ncbi:hypothetical protein ABZP36_017429 [Zizania latifolia]
MNSAAFALASATLRSLSRRLVSHRRMVECMDYAGEGKVHLRSVQKKRGLNLPGDYNCWILIFADGVVPVSDTRATEGPIADDKTCEKIRYCTKYVMLWCRNCC